MFSYISSKKLCKLGTSRFVIPTNDPEIVCYLAINKPNNCTQYGGVLAAPLVGEIMEQSLTYLGVNRDYEN